MKKFLISTEHTEITKVGTDHSKSSEFPWKFGF